MGIVQESEKGFLDIAEGQRPTQKRELVFICT
jgi:hypothetical protein